MKNIALIGWIPFLIWVAPAWATVGQMTDIDGDGYKEAMVYRSDEGLVRQMLLDADHDRYFETVIHYKDGNRESAERDLNDDGHTDVWIHYYFTGVAWKMAEDLDRDGKADYWTYFRDQRIYRWEQDRNHDGIPDVRTTYNHQTAGGRTQVLAQQSYDDDFDGYFETFSGITAQNRAIHLPRSLAEALLR